jgi:hypothetical protein
MLRGLRFLWQASSGHRFRPWRSPYLRWRLETYSGLAAEEIGLRQFLAFSWRERGELLRFLNWTGKMAYFRRHSLRPVESAHAGPSDAADQPGDQNEVGN